MITPDETSSSALERMPLFTVLVPGTATTGPVNRRRQPQQSGGGTCADRHGRSHMMSAEMFRGVLIRERKPEECLRAFLNNNYFGMAIFAGIALHYVFA